MYVPIDRQTRRPSRAARRGAILPLVAIALVGLVGFVALAIDLGMLMVARNHCQNAADAAALAGVRTINGDPDANFNIAGAPVNAVAAAVANRIAGGTLPGDPGSVTAINGHTFRSGGVTVEIGSYTYHYDPANPANDGFRLSFPRASDTEPYGAVRVTVDYDQGEFYFADVWGLNSYATGAKAVAVHRPRDIVAVVDLSGSKRFQSLPGTPMTSSSVAAPSAMNRPRTRSLNPDPDFPRFGHYSDVALAALQGTVAYTTGDEFVDPSNISVASTSGPPIAEFFWQDRAATIPAFTRAPAEYATAPGGDDYLRADRNNPGRDYAATAREVLGTPPNQTDAEFEADGYDAPSLGRPPFAGYTYGPSYWGKTFFIWPPDPREATAGEPSPFNYADNGAKDWRQRFFIKVPVQESFDGDIEQSPDGSGPNEYPAGYSGWVRVKGLPAGQAPQVGDMVTVRNDTTRLYTIVGVRPSTWPGESADATKAEIQLSRPLRTRVRDFDNVEIQFRETGWLDENRLLFDENSGHVRAAGPFAQSGSFSLTGSHNTVRIGNVNYFYRINYAAILHWLKHTGPNPFPPSLRAGGIIYYSAMPDETDPLLNDRMWSGDWTGIGDEQRRNEVFWRDYIDFVLGVQWRGWDFTNSSTGTRFESYTRFNNDNGSMPPLTSLIGNGDLYRWRSFRISPKPTVANTPAYLAGQAGFTPAGTTLVPLFGTGVSPRAGDIVIFSSAPNRTYTVAANPTPTQNLIALTEPLAADVPNGATVTFRQVGYMHYDDNPERFRHQYWFGPQTLIDYLGNYNTGKFWWPGSVPEAQAWACKMGIQAAIDDIKKNHPNDFLGLVYFSNPRTRNPNSGNVSSSGKHNRARVALRSTADGDHYKRLINSLWFPPSVVDGTVDEIWYDDPDMANVPRAEGGTAPAMGFMLAYNLLSSSTSLDDLRLYARGARGGNPNAPEVGIVGGLGRKGAQKMVILETDGAPNTAGKANFVRKGPPHDNQSYFNVRVYDPSDWNDARNELPRPDTYRLSDLYDVVDTLVSRRDHPTRPGHATVRHPVLIHCIAYGTLFDPANAGATQSNALSALQTIQFKGNTAATTSAADFPQYKRIYGSVPDRVQKMKDAFTKIMQEGVSVSLLE